MNNFGIIVAENEEYKAIIDVLEKINMFWVLLIM